MACEVLVFLLRLEAFRYTLTAMSEDSGLAVIAQGLELRITSYHCAEEEPSGRRTQRVGLHGDYTRSLTS